MILNFINNLKSNLKNELYLFNSIKFLLITSISKFLSFLVYPILSRYFTISDFGYYDIFIVFIVLTSTIALLGLDSMIYRFLHDESIKGSKRQLVSNTLFTQIIAVTLFLSIIYFCYLNNIFDNDIIKLKDSDFLFLGLALFGMVFYSVSEVILKISASLKKYAVLTIANASLFLLCTYISVKYFNISILTYLKLYSILYFLLGILGLFLIGSYLSIKNVRIIKKEYLSYGLPLCLLTLIPLIQVFVGQNFILKYLDEDSLGIFAAASKLTILFTLPALAVSNSTIPILLRSSKDVNFNFNSNKFLFFTIISMSFCLFILTLFSSELSIIVFGKNYKSSGVILSFLCLGLYLKSAHGVLSLGSLIKNRTIYRFFSNLIVMFISLFTSYFFIKSYGLIGLIVGFLIGNSVQLILDFYISQKLLKIQWEKSKIFMLIIFSLCLFMFLQYLHEFSIIVKVLLSFLIFFLNITLYIILVLNKKNIKSQKSIYVNKSL
tara:strand:- start:13869 stop:15347 length:1479 start_codon:yes stop_codon:yes gene_type:complete